MSSMSELDAGLRDAGVRLDAEYPPFVADGWLKLSDAERMDLVRPFYADYLGVRGVLIERRGSGRTIYNADFKGLIPGIAPAFSGTSDDDENTAIYLLQTLHTLTLERAMLADFVESGGRLITWDDVPAHGYLRGTVAVVGFYSGGTGYRVHADVRVMRNSGGLIALPRGRRTNGYRLAGRELYFRPADVARRGVNS